MIFSILAWVIKQVGNNIDYNHLCSNKKSQKENDVEQGGLRNKCVIIVYISSVLFSLSVG